MVQTTHNNTQNTKQWAKMYITKHKIEGRGYCQISNAVAQDNTLSLGAKAVYMLIKSMPSTYAPSTQMLANNLGVSKRSVLKYLHELIARKLLKLDYELNAFGLKSGVFSVEIFDNPCALNEVDPVIYAPKKAVAKNQNKLNNENKTALNSSQNGANFIVNGGEKNAWGGEKNDAGGMKNFTLATPLKVAKSGRYETPLKKHETNMEKIGACALNFENVSVTQNNINENTNHNNKSFSKRLNQSVCSDLSCVFGNLFVHDFTQQELEALARFFAYRSERLKLTYASKRAILDNARALKALNVSVIEAVEQSIRRCYRDLYAPKIYAYNPKNKAFKAVDKPDYSAFENEAFKAYENANRSGAFVF